MALKFGSSSKSSTFKRQGFPMHSGTTSHSSALKEAKENKDKATSDRAVELALRNKELELQKKNEQLEKERAKKETKKELKKKGVKDDQGNYILGEFESADEKYDPKKDPKGTIIYKGKEAPKNMVKFKPVDVGGLGGLAKRLQGK